MNSLQDLESRPLEIKRHKDSGGRLILDNSNEWLTSLEKVEEIINNLPVDETNYKQAKKVRSILNKEKTQLTHLKTSFIKDYTFDYEEKSNLITKKLAHISSNLDDKINFYEISIGVNKPKLMTVVFKTYNGEDVDKLLKYGAEIGIKGEIK